MSQVLDDSQMNLSHIQMNVKKQMEKDLMSVALFCLFQFPIRGPHMQGKNSKELPEFTAVNCCTALFSARNVLTVCPISTGTK